MQLAAAKVAANTLSWPGLGSKVTLEHDKVFVLTIAPPEKRACVSPRWQQQRLC